MKNVNFHALTAHHKINAYLVLMGTIWKVPRVYRVILNVLLVKILKVV